MPGWLSALVVMVNRVALPLAGAYGILFDRPLQPLLSIIYVVMMGLLPASVLERMLAARASTAPGDGTPPDPPARTPSAS